MKPERKRPSPFGLLPKEMAEVLVSAGLPAYRGKQVLTWVFGKLEAAPLAMTDLPKDLRQRLTHLLELRLPDLVNVSATGGKATAKMAFRMQPGEPPVETVLLLNARRRPTFCLSSQLGCALDCSFCRTATMGLVRNLTTAEMVFQVWVLRRELVKRGLPPSSHSVVFMGMGEPLANRANLGRALTLLNHKDLFGLSWRKMTVSTAGIVGGIDWMARSFPQVNLALSLNAPTDPLRRKLMPSTPEGGVRGLVEAMVRHFETTGRLGTFEYVLIAEINDSLHQARQLVELLSPLSCLVNLIPFNPSSSTRLRPSSLEVQRRFLGLLRDGGLRATLRRSPGTEIQAACGQLATE